MSLTIQKQNLVNEIINLLKQDSYSVVSLVNKAIRLIELHNNDNYYDNYHVLFKAHLDNIYLESEQGIGNGEQTNSAWHIQAYYEDRTTQFGDVFSEPLHHIESYLPKIPGEIIRNRHIGNFSEANKLTKLRFSFTTVLTNIKARVESFVNQVKKDCKIVSDTQKEVALILKGGGIKGLALIGALIELEKYYTFSAYVGTSAGAIVAGLLAAGGTLEQLETILRGTDFRRFQDANMFFRIKNLILNSYLYPGREFDKWISEQVQLIYQSPEGKIKPPKLKDLNQRLSIYAVQEDEGAIVFDSDPTSSENGAPLTFAIRCSMSIPGYFKAPTHNGKPIYDGGVGYNFPAEHWLAKNPGYKFIGVYLGPKAIDPKGSGLVKGIANIVTNKNDAEFIDTHREHVVVIDPSPIETTDFGISSAEADFLVLQGRADALEHLYKYLPDNIRPDLNYVNAVKKNASEAKENIIAWRVNRKKRTEIRILAIAIMTLTLMSLAVLYYLYL